MDTYSEWVGPDIITPPTTSESFTLDFKSAKYSIGPRLTIDYGEVLGRPEFKVLLNNRWGVKVVPVYPFSFEMA
jgi:hypothetical protein